MTSLEVSEAMAFYMLEPYGDKFDYYGAAVVACTVYNVNRGKKDKVLTPEDFIPKFRAEKQAGQTMDEQIAFASVMTASLGGEDKR